MSGYLLDTNIISETRKIHPNPSVVAFVAAADSEALFISVLTLGELNKGIEIKRKADPVAADKLSGWLATIESTFADRVLPITLEIARLWGNLSATRSVPVIDTLIAATAIAHNLILVTRNSQDFAATGAQILDPWGAP